MRTFSLRNLTSWLNSRNRSTKTIFGREYFPLKLQLQYFGTYSHCGLLRKQSPIYSDLGVLRGMFSPKRSRWPPIFLFFLFFTFLTLTSLTHHLSMVKFSGKKSMLENFRANVLKAIPIKCFVSHRPTDPLFWKSKKKKKEKSRITCKEASTLVYKHTILSY